ncbi:MAG: general secretion pathway protein GspK [Candidatus Omnitrophica bacterium]|nr:general secretion pathway protein GspK [Candidatus Omnitrophota bacterium]
MNRKNSLFKQAPDVGNPRGTILIVTLWILLILTLFALALGERASLEVNLTKYQRDKAKAIRLAQAAIERAIWEKLNNDTEENSDSFHEPWANNQAAFKDVQLGAGTFTVGYSIDASTLDENKITFYGLEDEQSKININNVKQKVLKHLLESCGVVDFSAAAQSILVWSGKMPDTGDEEGTYYENLDPPYPLKAEEFQSLGELLLVQHFSPAIVYGGQDENGDVYPGLSRYLTVYGEDQVNINTASQKVLLALTEGDLTLVDKVMQYRRGYDGEIGTEDDNIFTLDSQKFAVNEAWADYGESEDLPSLNNVIPQEQRCVSSDIYTISAKAEVKRVRKTITATVSIPKTGPVQYLYWHQN